MVFPVPLRAQLCLFLQKLFFSLSHHILLHMRCISRVIKLAFNRLYRGKQPLHLRLTARILLLRLLQRILQRLFSDHKRLYLLLRLLLLLRSKLLKQALYLLCPCLAVRLFPLQ